MNKFIFLLTIMSLSCFTNGVKAQKVERLFNGKDLSGWNFVVEKNSEPADQVYSVRDSVVHVKGTLGYMYTKKNTAIMYYMWNGAGLRKQPTAAYLC
jgi:hypothetical protein